MAIIYLRSTDGDDGSDGSTWALAKATLAAALTAAGVGGTVYVSQAHAESTAAAIALASPGTAASPVVVLCAQDGGGSPVEPPTTLATTGHVTTTGNSTITFTGFAYYYGIHFESGDGATGTATTIIGNGVYSTRTIFDNCILEVGTTGTVSYIAFQGSRDEEVRFINTNVKFNATAQRITPKGRFYWTGGTLDVTAAIPTQLFSTIGGNTGAVEVQGVDLSGTTGALVLAAAVDGGGSIKFAFKNCRLNASTTALTATAIGGDGAEFITIDNCGSGDTNYTLQRRTYQGSTVQETTIVRTAGASDGTTPLSWKMVSLATPTLYSPLESPPIFVWNETTGSAMTATVEFVHDSLTNLQDDEIWAEAEYLGTSGYSTSSVATDRITGILSTPADQTDSSVEWTTTGLSNPNTQKLVVTFTPQEKGPVVVRVMLAKASQTVYVCPKVTVA